MKKKLGEILIASGVVSQADINEALRDQSAGEPARLGDQLIALGRLTSFQLAKALSEQHGLPYMGLPAIPPRVMSAIPLDYQRTHRLVPFRIEGDTVSVAVADPSNTDAIEELRYSLNRRIVVAIAPGDEIDSVHEAYASTAQPASAVVAKAAYTTRATPAPTADELFGSLNLESLDSPSQVESSQSGLQDLFKDVGEQQAPVIEEELNLDDDELSADAEDSIEVSESFEPEDEVSFSSSSPSSLESLVISPHVPVLPDRPVAPSVPAPEPRTALGARVPPPAPSGPPLPAWLKNPEAASDAPIEEAEPPAVSQEWSGKLDDVPPSRLIVAAVKALVTSGVVSEEAILALLAKK